MSGKNCIKKVSHTAQKMKFSIKDFFSKCDQIPKIPADLVTLLNKSLMENFIFSVVIVNFQVSVSFLILTLTILENCKVKTVGLLNKPASLRRYFCFLKETTAFNFN